MYPVKIRYCQNITQDTILVVLCNLQTHCAFFQSAQMFSIQLKSIACNVSVYQQKGRTRIGPYSRSLLIASPLNSSSVDQNHHIHRISRSSLVDLRKTAGEQRRSVPTCTVAPTISHGSLATGCHMENRSQEGGRLFPHCLWESH